MALRNPIRRSMLAGNPTTVVAGGPATVVGGTKPSGGHHGHGGSFYAQGPRYPYPYPYPYLYPAFPAFSSSNWFGGWGYNYPFGYGYGYPGWSAPYARPYSNPNNAPMALGA